MQRREFLKAGGGLVVAFTLPTLPLAALAEDAPPTGKDMRPDEVDTWLVVGNDGKVTVYSGKVDLGTGARTALAQLVAEELDVDFGAVRLIMGDTGLTVDQGQTAGSQTISNGGAKLRQAAASARQALLAEAAQRLSVEQTRLTVAKGVVTAGEAGPTITYAALVSDKPLNVKLDPKVKLKDPGAYTIIGKSIQRVDIPGKVTGEFTYMHDFKLPGMLHARVVRPPSIGATLVDVDETSVRDINGFVSVVRKDNFVAVLGKTEWSAIKAARALKTNWNERDQFPDQAQLFEYWRGLPRGKDDPVVQSGDADGALASAAKHVKATYDFPVHTHGSIGPSCAVADFRDGHCTIWSPSQSTHSLQGEIARTLDIDKAAVRLVYLDGSGCYGRNGHEDCSADAALISQLAKAPVRVQWMRADEHGWDPKSPPTLVDLQAGLDDTGALMAWKSEFFIAQARGTMDEFPLLAAVLSGKPRPTYLTGNISKNSDVMYEFPHVKTEVHRMADKAFRTAHLRTPGRMQNTFANEAFFDEVAAAANADPLQWRLKYLKDPRSRAVLEDVAKMSGWQSRPSPAGQGAEAMKGGDAKGGDVAKAGDTAGAHAVKTGDAAQGGDVLKGRGVAFVRYDNERTYVAVVVQVEVDKRNGGIRVTDVWCSHDCGQVVNPDGVRNQVEGGIVQTISRTLMEQITFDRQKVTSLDWSSYPILRFTQVPAIHVHLIDRPEKPAWGAGEMAPTVIPAAISNAVFDATGVRLRSVPFLPDKVLAALKAPAAA
ncbi:isoquinoline 1-oxidoreductase [Bordetella sp. H567]|uniref:molybdopterin cofactor-binding domain-containing protein n=1 Tax=Bordetella sp. H567 TaxID=1697043 RepID=UPI00081C6290|nr:molybdopterin cofactor-binding domain-containing protein [Bordetella sp. H567]AOB33433.1 isoquinoline 1-oxidoreductase [Bordetella sp. H567]